MDINSRNSADQKVIRSINRSSVLNIIRENGSISRAAISKITGLKKPSVSSVVSELIDMGMVLEEGKIVSDGSMGRKPISLRINEEGWIIGVIDVNVDSTELAICDLGKNVLELQTVKSPVELNDSFFRECGKTLSSMIAARKKKILGVGVCLPYWINNSEGTVLVAGSDSMEVLNIGEIVEKEVDCKVLVINDAKAGAFAELWFGDAGKNMSDFAFILVREGIGVGLVFNNAIYHGAHGFAGEFGKQIINSRYSGDGSRFERWEDFASEKSIIRRYAQYSGNLEMIDTVKHDDAMQSIIDRALNNEEAANKVIEETCFYLAIGISNIIYGLDLEKIIISGRIVQIWDTISSKIEKQLIELLPKNVVDVSDWLIPCSFESPTFEGTQAIVHNEIFKPLNI